MWYRKVDPDIAEAAAQELHEGKSYKQVSETSGMSRSSLYRWYVKFFGQSPAVSKHGNTAKRNKLKDNEEYVQEVIRTGKL